MSHAKIKALDITTEQNELLCIENHLDGICPDPDHRCKRFKATYKEFKEIINEDEEYFSEVESICFLKFRGDLFDLQTIRKFCPKISCVIIIGSQFTPLAINLMQKRMSSKLLHSYSEGSVETISLDNFRATDLSLFTARCKKLTDLSLDIKATDNCFNPRHLKALPETLKFVYLIDQKGVLSGVLVHLKEGKGRHVEFLRAKSNVPSAYEAFQYLPELVNLRGLNIDVEIDRGVVARVDIVSYYIHVARCKLLETLTLALPFKANKILRVISNGEFKRKLVRLKLENAKFNKSIKLITKNFKSLEVLQMIECLFKSQDMNEITESIINIKSLKKLIIENNYTSDENNGYIALGFKNIQQFINFCPELEFLFVQPSVEFNDQMIARLNDLAFVKNVDLQWSAPS